MMSTLPTLEEIQNSPSNTQSPLALALEILFERSPVLVHVLEPQLNGVLKSLPPLASYSQFIDIALSEIEKWDIQAQAEFISGHPRIGESKNLSKLSANEQGAQGVKPTPPEVLVRLAHLNACYEVKYPGLRYITFVNGRTRAAIAEEMEEILGLPHSFSDEEPALDSISPVEFASHDWRTELDRAVNDIGRIAKSRLGTLSVN
ncbi:Oxo-4-hydroxy-4-carboxy-5-ureidoimidazoline decarboxylase [Flammula alnicola]|nr:Oxo-4-hydroxy-4-carboxy-5-ureidoimidazoline decarboxylase [Flammula alnicola]